MSLQRIGTAAVAVNNIKAPSGLAGDIVKNTIISSAVKGVEEGLGISEAVKKAFENATVTIKDGARVVASPLTGAMPKKKPQEHIQEQTAQIQGDEK